MLRVLDETLHAISLTTLHPIGWGWHRVVRHFQMRKPHIQAHGRLAKKPPVFFVHGILHNSTAFYKFEKLLGKRHYIHIKTVELMTSLTNVESMAEKLKFEVNQYLQKNTECPENIKFHIVAHSLGGIVVRLALLDPAFAKNTGRVVFLGTPHEGNNVFIKFPIPKSLPDIDRNSPTMKRLRSEPLPGGIEYFNIRGGLDIVTPLWTTFLPHVPSLMFDGVGHAGLLSNKVVVDSVVSILDSCSIELD